MASEVLGVRNSTYKFGADKIQPRTSRVWGSLIFKDEGRTEKTGMQRAACRMRVEERVWGQQMMGASGHPGEKEQGE